MSLIKHLIEIADKSIYLKRTDNTWSYEGICYLFARSIVAYSKMAYDNMILGHFDSANMIMRVIIENNVCLDIILRNSDIELWKYYLVHSYKNSITRTGEELDDSEKSFLKEIYSDYNIEKEFIEKSKKKETGKPYAYIDRNYGWTYKINKDFSFAGLCNLVDGCDYMGFKMMSKYSHGTSIHLKIGSSTSIDSIMNMVSSLYIGLYRLITMYCENEVESDFYDVTEKLENIINDYLENSPYN